MMYEILVIIIINNMFILCQDKEFNIGVNFDEPNSYVFVPLENLNIDSNTSFNNINTNQITKVKRFQIARPNSTTFETESTTTTTTEEFKQFTEENVSATTDVLQTPRFRVVSGKVAKLGDVPWQVAIKIKVIRKYNSSGKDTKKRPTTSFRIAFKSYCGGSIIGPDKVLSAAHCFERHISRLPVCKTGMIGYAKLDDYYVVAGSLKSETRRFEEGQWRDIYFIRHPINYKFPQNDICVVNVLLSFKFNSFVHPVRMQRSFEDMTEDCLASGFGGINNAFSKTLISSPVLMKADLRVLPNRDCMQLHSEKYGSRFVCTAYGNPDISKGDSGGPLVCLRKTESRTEAVLVGVACGLKKLSQTKGVTFFTRVSEYQRFISYAEDLKLRLTPSVVVFVLISKTLFL